MILEKVFNIKTFTHSDTADKLGIENLPNDEQLKNLEELHQLLLEIRDRLCTKYQKPIQIKINVAFRNPEVNKAVGGVATSEHLEGKAVDSVALGITIKEYFDSIKELCDNNVITIGQCINERTWLHLSTPSKKHHNQFLQLQIINGKKRYLPA